MAVLAGFLLSLHASPTRALDPHRALTQALLRKWQMPQGLPQPTIFKIAQTSDGYLWLGTRSGLFRFDGMRFIAPPNEGELLLNELWVQDLCEDREHNLWIATSDQGTVRLNGSGAARLGRNAGLPSENVRALLLDRAGNFWAGTEGGLARWIPREGRFTREEFDVATPDGPVRALCEDRDGTLWIGGEGARLSLWNGHTLAQRTLALLPARASIRALLGAADGSLWIGTTAGLVHLGAADERLLTHADGLPDDAVECLAQSRDGTVWAGTRDGLCRLQKGTLESFRSRDGLSQSTVFTLAEDHEGSLWVGTKHGLNQFVDRRTIPLTVSEGLPSNETGPLLQDEQGTVWIGTLDQGLARSDGRHCWPVLGTAEGLPTNRVLALVVADEGAIWIGTDRGLYRIRDGRIEASFTTETGLPSNVVRCLCRDRRGAVWVGTDAGLAELQNERIVAPADGLQLTREPVVALVEYGTGILASTEKGGLYHYTDRRCVPFRPGGGELQDVGAFYVDRDGSLWMGTQGHGLWLATAERSRQFEISDGLYDDEIFGIVADAEDRLWMACSRGIFFVSRSDLLQRAAGRLARVESTPFSPTDSLRTVASQDGVQPCLWRMQDGRIWFSTVHGVLILDPAHVNRNLPAPPVRIEEVQANGQSIEPDLPAKLPPGRTNLYFRYTALSFASPTRLAFRHRLEGYDRDWVEAGARREAFYTNLPPGSYRFRVSAANPGESWSEARHPIAFTVAPHFHQTAWFVPTVAAVCLAAGWLAFRIRVLQVKARWNAVVGERSRIARELHDTLIQGFSGVTMQMQALAARLRQSPERASLEDIIQDAGNCLREARLSVGGLRGRQENISGLSEAIARAARQLTETRDVRLLLQIEQTPRGLPGDVEYNVLRIAQEAVTNAVQHAGARTIEVRLNCEPRGIVLSVRDDGAGCPQSELEHPRPGHYGLIGMRERASQVHAELRLDSEPGRGTTVHLKVPLRDNP